MLVNGQPQGYINLADRAVQFGDGIFTTFRIKDGKALLWPLHEQRLREGCLRLHIAAPPWNVINTEVHQLAIDQEQGVGKVIISRGEGGRGYSMQQLASPTRIVAVYPLPDHISAWRQHGIALHWAKFRLSIQPVLAGLKHLNRLEQIMGRREITDAGWDEAIFCDSDERIVECNAFNLFWRKEDMVYTPRIESSGVRGVMARSLMEHCAVHGHTVKEVAVRPAALDGVDEVFICNSLFGAVPVRTLGARSLPSHFLCRLLQKEADKLDA